MTSPQIKRYAPGGGYSLRGAARELGTNAAQIARMIERGQLRAVEFGSKLIIPPSEIERYKKLLEISGEDN